MIIDKLETIIVSQKLGGWRFSYSQAWYDTRTIMLLKITTDDGLVGWGESFGNAYVNKSIIDNVYAPAVIGENVFHTEKVWEKLYNMMRDNGQKGSPVEAISAIDIAMWDLKGQYTGLPVYDLAGGARRERIIPYATGLYRGEPPFGIKELVSEAVSYAEAGFRAIKMKIGFGIDDDVAAVKAVREAIGAKIKLMADANHAYNACTASKLARRLEEYEISWLEEPVPPEDIDGYKEVKSNTCIPIAGGEAEFTRYGFNRLLGSRAVDIVQPDCAVTGGFSEFMKIANLATIYNIQCLPHIWGSAVAVRCGMHCAFALPNYPDSLNPCDVYMELDRTPNIFRENLSAHAFDIKDGYIYPPKDKGLGLDIDEKLIAQYRVC
ncbi:MAG: mandelate racemase/muconate lactonizing enzyme family protein [Treponema sp.]|nr:mandelate racemase/muconate lactonizing enzyme family protein [Treponema sp.]